METQKETKPGNGNGEIPQVPQVVEHEKSLAPQSLMPASMNGKYQLAKVLVKSGLIPKHFDTPEKAMVALQMGHELGLKPMMSLNNIFVVDGKPTLQSSLMMAIITNNPEFQRYTEEYDNDDKPTWCRVSIERLKNGKLLEYSTVFSLDDAKTAGLLTKTNWTKYPKAMMTARAQAATARKAFPDVLAGMYTPEEITEGENNGYTIEDPKPKGNLDDFMRRIDDAKTGVELEAIPKDASRYEWNEDQAKILDNRYNERKKEIASMTSPKEPEQKKQETPKDEEETNPQAASKLEDYKKEVKEALKRGDTKAQISLMKAGRETLGVQYKELVTYTNSLSKKSA